MQPTVTFKKLLDGYEKIILIVLFNGVKQFDEFSVYFNVNL